MSAPSNPIRLKTTLRPRSPDETHRSATPLELFFDLVFVVAIAQAASGLHHEIADNHVGDGVFNYLFTFFAIWWAWLNFTWFASAYDPDDVAYRIVVFIQLIGALILAAGVSGIFDDGSWGTVLIGYVVMRLAMVIQWIRVARADKERRPTAMRYAIGVASVQMAWCTLFFLPEDVLYPGFVALVVVELLIPIWAERVAPTTWHAGHIAERYGLFTIIVLGESILAATIAIESTSITTTFDASIAGIIVGGLLIVFSMWWLYFARNSEELLNTMWRAFSWGYGHYFIFGAAAAVGAGIAVSVDQATDHAEIGALGAGLSVTIPIAMFLIGIWLLHFRFWATYKIEQALFPLFAVVIVLASWSAAPVLLAGLLLSLLVALELAIHLRASRVSGAGAIAATR